jgi:hypothetical protein
MFIALTPDLLDVSFSNERKIALHYGLLNTIGSVVLWLY